MKGVGLTILIIFGVAILFIIADMFFDDQDY